MRLLYLLVPGKVGDLAKEARIAQFRPLGSLRTAFGEAGDNPEIPQHPGASSLGHAIGGRLVARVPIGARGGHAAEHEVDETLLLRRQVSHHGRHLQAAVA